MTDSANSPTSNNNAEDADKKEISDVERTSITGGTADILSDNVSQVWSITNDVHALNSVSSHTVSWIIPDIDVTDTLVNNPVTLQINALTKIGIDEIKFKWIDDETGHVLGNATYSDVNIIVFSNWIVKLLQTYPNLSCVVLNLDAGKTILDIIAGSNIPNSASRISETYALDVDPDVINSAVQDILKAGASQSVDGCLQAQPKENTVEEVAQSIEEQAPSSVGGYGRGCCPEVFIVDELATALPPLTDFPKDDLDTALHSDQLTANYTDRANKLIAWLGERNSVQAVTELLRAHNSPDCEKWLAHIEPDALKAEFDEGVRLYLVKRALHLSFLTIQDEDISNVLMAINAPDTGHVWFAMFERQVIPVMIRLGL